MRYEYVVAGEAVALESDDDLIAVRYQPGTPRSLRAAIASAAGGDFTQRVELLSEPFTVVRVQPAPVAREPRRLAAMNALDAAPAVARTAPVFRISNGHAIATERVLVRFASAADPGQWLLANPARRLGPVSPDGEATLTLGPAEDPLAVAAALAGDRRLAYAEPDFVNVQERPLRRLPTGPLAPVAPAANDPLLDRQYAMAITRARDAWALHAADPTVTIAVLDEGVDTLHEDLHAATVGAFDAIDGDGFQEPNPWDGHGTACAGLALARGDNGVGIRGVAGGCSLLAVRIARSAAPHAPWQTSNEQIAAAIDWAWAHGAWVLSNSWGGGAPSNRIADAFARARTQGRGGRGCVVVIAAGNGNGPVEFPGTLPGVIVVAASNEADQPKTPTSQDGEYWWGSSYGPEVVVAAPGVHNLTTDITGAGGYNTGGAIDANYTPDFNGTSSATPIVAGAAALVLSARPTLTEADVRAILRDTAAKVGAIPYVGGRNDRMGYGRVDVRAAVARALEG